MTKCVQVQYYMEGEWRTQCWIPASKPDIADDMVYYMGYFADLNLEMRFEMVDVDWM